MRLYVCWGTFGGDWHACSRAEKALRAAGHDFEVKRTYGSGRLPLLLNTPQRRSVARLSGDPWVPVLELDDGSVVSGSGEIVDWAQQHPA